MNTVVEAYSGEADPRSGMLTHPGPKKIAKSTGKPDRRQRDNKETPKNNPKLNPHNHKKGD